MLVAAQSDSLWQKANALYAGGKFAEAAEVYAQLEESGAVNDALFYNAGNAFYKLGETAKAILRYERALKIDARNEDALYNLALANEQIVDKIEPVPQFFLVTWIQTFRNMLSMDAWAILGVALLLVALALMLLAMSGAPQRRKLSFALAIVLLCLSLTATYVAFRQEQDFFRHKEAIVLVPVTSVKASPDGGGLDLFVLHEGTKVAVLETIGSWKKIKTADGNQGWLPVSAIELI
jgi:tetratricopeptide (TPR) repeat protein